MKRMLTVVLLAACAIGTMPALAAPSEVAVAPSYEGVHAADLGAIGVLGGVHELKEQKLLVPAFSAGIALDVSLARTGQRAGGGHAESEPQMPSSLAREQPWRPLRCFA